ncbi:Uncharacterised protein [uncultured archaeon]|nr:Uncharacterised protein [uncultured archaeon]
MNNISKKKLVFIVLLAVFAIIVLEWPLQKTEGVHIGLSIGTSQGAAENNTEMEIIKMNGTFWNEGDGQRRN